MKKNPLSTDVFYTSVQTLRTAANNSVITGFFFWCMGSLPTNLATPMPPIVLNYAHMQACWCTR